MKTFVVRYELDPKRLDEHVALIDAVFDDLRANPIAGLQYAATRSADGTVFTHIANYENAEVQAAATSREAFQAFGAKIGERCLVAPAVAEQTIVENCNLFA